MYVQVKKFLETERMSSYFNPFLIVEELWIGEN